MNEGRSPRERGLTLTQGFMALEILQGYELSVTSGQIIIEVFLQTSDAARPRLSTPTETATRLGKHISSINRAMIKLADPEPDGLGLLQRSSGPLGSRSEMYALTEKGLRFVSEFEAALNGSSPQPLEALTVERYADAVLVKRLPSGKLRQVAWNEDALTLVVTPAKFAMSEEVGSWIADFMSEGTIRKQQDDTVAIEFMNAAEAFHFKLRWC